MTRPSNLSASHSRRSGVRQASTRLRFALQARAAVLALGASALLFGHSARAANDAWSTGPANNTFSGTNWTVGSTTGGAATGMIGSGDSLYFDSSSFTTLNEDEAAGFLIGGFTFNSDSAAYTISGNDFTLSGAITNNSAANQTINDNITLTNNQTWLAGTANGTILTLGGSVTGSGIALTTNGGTGSPQVSSNTVFSGAVSLASLLAQGNANNGNNFSGNPTTTFTGSSSLTTTGNAVVGRSNLVFSGNTVANIAGSLTNAGALSVDWATVTISGSANVTAASLNMNGDGVTGLFNLNGGTLTTGSIVSVDSSDTQYGMYYNRNVFNGTQVIASQSNATFLNVVKSQYFTGSNEVYVGSGGALFNSNGFDIGTATTFHNSSGSTGILTKSGLGTLTLSGASDYTGATTVNGGALNLTGSLTSAVTVNSGGTLTGSGNNSTTGLIGGTVTAVGGSAITLASASSSTALRSTGNVSLGNTGTYGAANYATLNFTLATGNNVEAFNTPGVLTANNVFVSLSSLTNGTYTLANYGSLTAGYDFSLSRTAANVLSLRGETLTVGSTALTLTVAAPANPNVAYYNNAVGSGIWNDVSNPSIVNFSTNKAGTTDAGQVPGANTDVILVADNLAGTAVTSRLGGSTTINSLNVNASAASNTISADGSTLTINALGDSNTASDGSYTGNTAGTGINIAAAANAFTLNVPVALGNAQSWTNNSANLFTVGGTSVTGTAATGNTQILILANTAAGGTTVSGVIGDGSLGGKLQLTINDTGTGATILSGANTYTGGTMITAGVLNIANANALGTSGTVSFGGGTLQYGTGITTDFSARFGTVGQAYNIDTAANNVTFNSAFGGTGTNGNTLTKYGAGVLTLNGANTYTGGTTVNAGAIYINNNTGAGTGTITLAGTAALLYYQADFNNPLNITGNNVILNQGDNANGDHTGALTGAGTLTVPLSVTVNGNTYNGASSFKYNGDLSGFTGTFVDATNKNVIFLGAANNGYNAKFVIDAGSGNSTAFVGSNAGTGGIFQMGELDGASSTAVIYGNYNSGITTVYQIGALNTNSSYAGQILNSNNNVSLTKVGTGKLTLSGVVNITGPYTINAGTLQFAKTQSLYNGGTPNASNFIVASGATADFNVGGTGDFTAANIASIAALGTATGGFENGSTLALDTTDVGSFTYGTAITNTNGNANVLGLTKFGVGTLGLTGTNTYTGATTVAAGTLSLTGALGNTAVTVNSGATLTGGGNGSTTGVIGGPVSALGGSTITLSSGSSSTSLRSAGAITLGNTGAYSAANFTALNFTLATGNNAEALNTPGMLTANNVFVSASPLTNGTYTLANYGSVAAGYDFSLSSTTGNVLTMSLGRSTETLTVGATMLTLTVGGLANPNVAYFNGAVSSVWGDTSNANTVNFSTDLAGTMDAGQIPGANTDVILNASNATANRGSTTLTETLGGNTTINSLSVNGNGTTTLAADGSTLTINALADSNTASDGSYTGNTAGTGITIGSAANAFTLNVPVLLGNSQSWTNNSANLFTVGGTVGGTALSGTQTLTLSSTGAGGVLVNGVIGDGGSGGNVGLTINDTGTGAGLVTVLTGTNTYSGATTITAGTLQLGDGTTGHDGTITNSASVTIASGAVLNLNPFGTTASDNNPISGAGSVTKTGAGTASLGGTSSYTGGTTVTSGTLVDSFNPAAFGANNAATMVAIGSGGIVRLDTNTDQVYNDTFSGSGRLIINLLGGSGTYANNFNAFTGIIEIAGPNTGNKLVNPATNQLTGATIQIDNGSQLFAANNALSVANITLVGGGNNEYRGAIRLNSGTLNVSGAVSLLGDATIGNEGGTINGNITTGVAGTSTLTMGTFNSNNTALLNGVLSNGVGTLALTQSAGTTTLTGANTFTGVTNLSGGALLLKNSLALQNTTVTTGAGAVNFDASVASNAFSFGGLAGGGNVTLANNASTPAAVALTFGTNNATNTYAGILSGAGGSLTKAGTGTETFTRANTYSGATNIGTAAAGAANLTSATANGGILQAGVTNALGGTSNVTVNNGGTLLLSGATTTGTTPGGVSDRVNNAAPITLGTTGGTGVGGTIAVGAASGAAVLEGTAVSQNNGTTTPSPYQSGSATSVVGLGALTLASNSSLDFGTGGKGTLVFSTFDPTNGATGNFTLNILDYVNTTTDGLTTSGVDGTDDRLVFNEFLLPTMLADISFGTGTVPREIALDNGFYEIVPLAVPEPGTWAAAALSLGMLGYSQRRRLLKVARRVA